MELTSLRQTKRDRTNDKKINHHNIVKIKRWRCEKNSKKYNRKIIFWIFNYVNPSTLLLTIRSNNQKTSRNQMENDSLSVRGKVPVDR